MHGQRVRATYNPHDIHSIGVWTLDHRFICRAELPVQHDRNAPVTDEDRRESFRMRGTLRKAMRVVREHGHLQFANAAELAMAAQRHEVQRQLAEQAARPGKPANAALPADPPVLRVVQTPLDGQIDRVRTAFAVPTAEARELVPEGDIRSRLHAQSEEEDSAYQLPDLPTQADMDDDDDDPAPPAPADEALDADACDTYTLPAQSAGEDPHDEDQHVAGILDLFRRELE
jgi:hypothetical protein